MHVRGDWIHPCKGPYYVWHLRHLKNQRSIPHIDDGAVEVEYLNSSICRKGRNINVLLRWKVKMGLVNSPWVLLCKQASETPSRILCSCEALVTLRFRHLGRNFMQPGDSEDIFVSKILHFAQGMGVLNKRSKGLRKSLITVKVYRSLSACLSVFYPIQLYSIVFYSTTQWTDDVFIPLSVHVHTPWEVQHSTVHTVEISEH